LYVGLDLDREGLLSATDGALSRYKQLKKTHPNFPSMYFIHANLGGILDYENQSKILGNMNDENKKLINKFFPFDNDKKYKFDCINCQFVLHYLLKDIYSWSNLKNNINSTLKTEGFMVITTFDAKKIITALDNSDGHYIEYYTDNDGNKKIFFEIIKKYDKINEYPIGLGYTIDVHLSWISFENVFVSEYLVDKDFLIRELYKDCNMVLVETDLFENQYNIHKEYFSKYAKFESNEKTRKTLLDVAEYYKDNKFLDGCKKFTNFNRFYIFKKIKCNNNILGGNLNIQTNNMTYLPNIGGKFSFFSSIFNALKKQKIIHNKISLPRFYSNINVNIINDDKLNNDIIKRIAKSIIVKYEKKINNYNSLTNQNQKYIKYDNNNNDNDNDKYIYIDNYKINGLDVIILDNCETFFLNNNTNNIIVVLRDNNNFSIVTDINNGIVNCIFKLNSKFIKNLLAKKYL